MLPIVPDVPSWLVGHSGGAALALCGLHLHARCRGAYMLGADGLTEDLVLGEGHRPVALHYNHDDEVYGRNRMVVGQLVARGVAALRRDRPGRHSLESYIANGTLSEVLRVGEG